MSQDPRRLRSRWAWTQASRAQRRRVPYCEECGAVDDLTADHLIPLADGGHLLGPLRTLCRSCNSSRGHGGGHMSERDPRKTPRSRVSPPGSKTSVPRYSRDW